MQKSTRGFQGDLKLRQLKVELLSMQALEALPRRTRLLHYIISLFFLPRSALVSTPIHLSFLFLSSSFLLSCFCLTAANILALQPKFLKKFVSDPKRWRIGTWVILRDNCSLLSDLRRALLRKKKNTSHRGSCHLCELGWRTQ